MLSVFLSVPQHPFRVSNTIIHGCISSLKEEINLQRNMHAPIPELCLEILLNQLEVRMCGIMGKKNAWVNRVTGWGKSFIPYLKHYIKSSQS